MKVGLVLDKGGKDDKSFNAAAYAGATKAQKELGFDLKVVEAVDNNAFEILQRSLAKKNYDLIIAVGFTQRDALNKISKQFPDIRFASVDAEVDAPNVKSLLFEEHEGAYLVGAIAAMINKTGTVGFVGGMDIPLIRRFEMGYEAGVKKINPKIKVLSNYVGVTGDAWHNPAKGKELALSQISAGADIIFAAAGASSLGVFDAVEEKKVYAIGTDSNQNWIKPGRILTSMLKRVDVAVYETLKALSKNQYKAGIERFDLKTKGIDYALDQYNDKLISADVRKKADQLKADIIAGKIQVPDYYKVSHK